MDFKRVCYGCFQEKPEGSPVCPYCGFSAEEEQPYLALPMGTVLRGRYLMGRVLGVGGFGITYLGYDLVLEIRVAVKEYMPSGLAMRHADRYRVVLTGRRREDYENGLNRFLEEARILAKLQGTPHIVSVQDHFQENNTAYFVMEYVDGMSLKAYLAAQGGRIPFDQALTILQPIMQALTRVHELGLTHRDISPDNISITAGGESKLLDFGAARFSAGEDRSVSVILKHGFAPEEQYASHGRQGPWTDVYAMGATLYRCITGELPPDSIARVHHDTMKKPSELGMALPARLEAAMMKALAVKAQDRFPSMEAFLGAVTGGSQTPETGRAKALPRKKAFALIAAALALCAAAGLWRYLWGRAASPDAEAVQPPASVSEPERGGSTQPALAAYSNGSLNCSLQLPDALQETAPGSAVFLSPDGSCSLQIGFYTYWSGFPVYTLSDVEANSQTYVQNLIGLLQSTDITTYQILHEGYRQIGALRGYLVQFEARESGGSTMGFLAAFLEGQNGFGCYNLLASYPQGDEAMQEQLLEAVQSFQCLGPAETSYRLCSDEGLPFRFMYAEGTPPWDLEIEDGILTAVSISGSDYTTLAVSALPLTGTETADEVLNQLTEGLVAVYPGVERRGAQRTQAGGGMDWVVQDYADESDAAAVYLSYAVSVWKDQAYFVILTSSQEEQLDENGLQTDILGSLRPAA